MWHVINPPNDGVMLPVTSVEQGKLIINALASYESKIFGDDVMWGNVFGLQVWDGEEWVEWYCEEGDDIDACECKNPVWESAKHFGLPEPKKEENNG